VAIQQRALIEINGLVAAKIRQYPAQGNAITAWGMHCLCLPAVREAHARLEATVPRGEAACLDAARAWYVAFRTAFQATEPWTPDMPPRQKKEKPGQPIPHEKGE
jgi:hypothetical protein